VQRWPEPLVLGRRPRQVVEQLQVRPLPAEHQVGVGLHFGGQVAEVRDDLLGRRRADGSAE
jgi:hypothetical protein